MQLQSKNPRIRFTKTHPDAKLPEKNHNDPYTGDAGFDLFAVEDTPVPARGWTIVPVGLTLAYITSGFWFRIEGRSGLGFKHGIVPHFGIIDNGYRGDMGIKLYNFSDTDVTIKKGQGCAQFIVYRMENCLVSFTDTVEQSDRGSKGFGSSDK